jgi:Protein of unknown function (DUF2892)
MEYNVGRLDRAIRFILAIAIGALGIYFQSWWGFLAVVPLFTGAFSFCPLYKILGINTCANKSVQ